ncbi:MAG: hypothetical protein QOH25_2774 [Acidobacteriota bacterium]|nr:hypothetical protein [Acidobacteriota bacterium]
MYCSSCGGVIARGLSYCNHCGARLGGAKDDVASKAAELFPESLVWAIVSVFVVGLGTTIGLMAVMKDLLDFSKSLIVAFSLVCFLLMFAIEGVLIWLLLSRRRSSEKKAKDSGQLKGQTTKELDAAQARALPEPVPSITEHTTRAFEPIYRERKSE